MALLQKAYLGATPLFRNTAWFEDYNGVTVPNFSNGGIAVAGSPAHTKCSWLQLFSSTSADCNLLDIFLQGLSAVATDCATVLDIGIGASGSETVVAGDIAVGGIGTFSLRLPISIPSGTRIAARIAGVRGSSQGCSLNTAGIYNVASSASLIPSSVDVLGVDTATSTGTAMSGASGTWVEIVASTSQDYIALSIIPSLTDTDTPNIAEHRLTVGVGAAGSEVEIGELLCNVTSNESINNRPATAPINMFGREIPAGSRLAIKHNIAANPSKYDACIIAVPKV
jgi:hypothetical protein